MFQDLWDWLRGAWESIETLPLKIWSFLLAEAINLGLWIMSVLPPVHEGFRQFAFDVALSFDHFFAAAGIFGYFVHTPAILMAIAYVLFIEVIMLPFTIMRIIKNHLPLA